MNRLLTFIVIFVCGIVIVAEPPREFDVSPLTSNKQQGHSKTDLCIAASSPEPEYSWSKDGQIISGAIGSSFRVTNISRNDAGAYRCVARNQHGALLSKEGIVYVDYFKTFNNTNVIFTKQAQEGQHLLIKLPPLEGIPPPSIKWMCNNARIRVGQRHYITLDNHLVLLSVQASDASCTYSASAFNVVHLQPVLTPEFSLNVAADATAGSVLEFIIPPKDANAEILASSVNFECVANARDIGNVVIQWFKGGVLLDDSESKYAFDDYQRVLTIKHVRSTDAGRYECQATLDGSSITAAAKLSVHTRPVFTSPHHAILEEDYGNTVAIACVATGNPLPTIMWYFNARPVNELSNSRGSVTDGTLSIESLDASDAGIYQCFIRNEFAEEFRVTWLKILNCSANYCTNGGTCLDREQGASCQCVPGYTGNRCRNNIDECSPTPCENNGTCHDEINNFSCQCVPGFTGHTCQTNIDDCSPNSCENGGTCQDGINYFTCQCVPGFTGNTCQANIDECSLNPCGNGGTCQDGINNFSCQCVPGFTGNICQTNVDECSPNPCENGGTCQDGVNDFTCQCVPGFTGNTCQTNIDECLPNPCGNGATCQDGVNDFTCQCVPGFTGHTCQTNIDGCSPNPCGNVGTSQDGVNDFTCQCVPGFTGNNCQTNIDECSPNPCGNGGTCQDGINTFRCYCLPEYTGSRCDVINVPGSLLSTTAGSHSSGAHKLCLVCRRIQHPQQCTTFVKVWPHEACETQHIALPNGTLIYNLGFTNKRNCEGGGHRDRRQALGDGVILCHKCCDSDLCNHRLCTARSTNDTRLACITGKSTGLSGQTAVRFCEPGQLCYTDRPVHGRPGHLRYDCVSQSRFEGRKHFCEQCLHCYSRENLLVQHKPECQGVNSCPMRIKMPTGDKKMLQFLNYHKQQKVPYIIYADFEALTTKIEGPEMNPAHSSTQKTQHHVACGFSYVVVRCDGVSKPPVLYRGQDAARHFLDCLAKEEREIKTVLAHPKPIEMTGDDWLAHKTATDCHVCRKPLKGDSVLDHCHITGQYRGAAHNACNLKLRLSLS